MELLMESGTVERAQIEGLMQEMNEVLAMMVASIKTLRARNPKSQIQNPKSKIQNRDAHPD
jgi:hypothetical protein